LVKSIENFFIASIHKGKNMRQIRIFSIFECCKKINAGRKLIADWVKKASEPPPELEPPFCKMTPSILPFPVLLPKFECTFYEMDLLF
jgi:hypothetical protein